MTPQNDARPQQPSGDASSFVLTPASGAIGRTVFASPHSGRYRPDDMGAVPGLSIATLRSAEDVGVDALVAPGPSLGAPLIAGRVCRTYVDLNRAADELDPELIQDCVPVQQSAKVAAGYGVIPRRAGDGALLYDRQISRAEADGRLSQVHAPYHGALEGLMHSVRDCHGMALLIDWHSMPSRATAAGRTGRGLDVVLGDRHGSACRGATSRRVRALFEAEGWRVGLNAPYAGGYATQRWGRPADGFQAIQVELNRALYLDEVTLEPSRDHDRFRKALGRVIAALAQEPWPR